MMHQCVTAFHQWHWHTSKVVNVSLSSIPIQSQDQLLSSLLEIMDRIRHQLLSPHLYFNTKQFFSLFKRIWSFHPHKCNLPLRIILLPTNINLMLKSMRIIYKIYLCFFKFGLPSPRALMQIPQLIIYFDISLLPIIMISNTSQLQLIYNGRIIVSFSNGSVHSCTTWMLDLFL